MVSAVLSVLLGIFSWFGAPVAVPVFALALGANAILKERRQPTRAPLQSRLGAAGVVLGGLATLVLLLR